MPRPARTPFESRLRFYRLRAGLTQEQLAHLVGVTPEMVRKHEQGRSFPIQLYRERYAQLFKVSDAQLWVRNIVPLTSAAAPARSVVHSLALDAPLNMDELMSARSEIPRIVALDNRFGAADIVTLAVRLFKSLQSRPHNLGSESKELYATLAELAEVAGWLAYDAEMHPLARRMNQESLHYARLRRQINRTPSHSEHEHARVRPRSSA